MNNLVQISVIIPVYNVKKYLSQCIESVAQESKYNIEIILVDDGSSDGSEKMCDEYANMYSNVKVIHKTNGGLGSARNVGVNNAIGDYILYLDSDDCIQTESITALYEKAIENNLDIVLFGATTFFDDENSALDMPRSNYRRKCRINEVCSGLQLITDEQKKNAYITSVCLRMYRREYLISGGYVFNETIIHEDIDYSFFSLLNAERVMACDKNYYCRRYRQGSIIMDSQLYKKFEGCEYAWNRFVNFIESEGVEENKKVQTIKRSEVYVRRILAIISGMSSEERQKIKKRYLNIFGKARKYQKYYKKSTIACLYFLLITRIYFRHNKKLLWIKRFARFVYSEPFFVFKLIKMSMPHKKERIYLLGTPIHGNAGDHIIAIAERQYLKQKYPYNHIIDCSMNFCNLFEKYMQKCISTKDVILISGGGWLGTEWPHNEIFVREKLRRFGQNRVIILPQTVYYSFENSFLHEGVQTYNKHNNLIFCLRENQSYEFVLSSGLSKPDRTVLLPDFALMYQKNKNDYPNKDGKVKICFRNDLEKSFDKNGLEYVKEVIKKRDGSYTLFDTVENITVPLWKRKKYVSKKLREIGEAKYVITDRLHAMIMCVLMGTPCIAYDNSTHKVKNVYKWFEELSYVHLMEDNHDLTSEIEHILQTERMQNLEEFKKLNLGSFFECMPKIIDGKGKGNVY